MFSSIKTWLLGLGTLISSALALFFAFKNQQKEDKIEEQEEIIKKESARADSFESKAEVATNTAKIQKEINESQEKLQEDIQKTTDKIKSDKEKIIKDIATKKDGEEYKVGL